MKKENADSSAAAPAVPSSSPRLNLDELVLHCGAHSEASGLCCVNEAVAKFAGEPHTWTPECECPVIGAVMVALNDTMDDVERQQLKRFIPLLANSRVGFEVALKRTFIFVDAFVRQSLPLIWAEVLEMKDEADALRSLSPIDGETTARAARDVVSPIYENHPIFRALRALRALRDLSALSALRRQLHEIALRAVERALAVTEYFQLENNAQNETAN